ncbi:spore protease YyaC [Cohnella hongkongensis]|uniref:Spore protease YyaC n=1 Tax=Cohnella hongkongensis TaxID=178337 RepID=A0ABV9FMU1_9BACL
MGETRMIDRKSAAADQGDKRMSAVRNRDETVRVDADGLRAFVSRIVSEHAGEELIFLCIGTDRSTGDSLGPWVGTLLEERGVAGVRGTLKEPYDANTLPRLLRTLPDHAIVIAIDACLGRPESVGSYVATRGPLVPARSVNGSLGAVGTYSIAGVVNESSRKPYWTLQSTSLYHVMGMAKEMADAIANAVEEANRAEST